ncbi:MAG: adenine phosphoribosyltransferase [Thermoplasmata archaeon]|nr:MAG: adenine phosphoribosyltransferase [Thermoplasmata archaeon]
MELEKLKKSLEESPIVKYGEYNYFIHPITDGVLEMPPEVLEEVTEAIMQTSSFEGCNKLVTAEAMGIPLGIAVSLKSGLPLNIIRKKSYGLEGEHKIKQITGYSKSDMYINALEAGDRIILIDDVLSTGGTLKCILETLRDMDVEVLEVIIAIEKTDRKKELERELGIEIKTLVKVEVVEGKVVVE